MDFCIGSGLPFSIEPKQIYIHSERERTLSRTTQRNELQTANSNRNPANMFLIERRNDDKYKRRQIPLPVRFHRTQRREFDKECPHRKKCRHIFLCAGFLYGTARLRSTAAKPGHSYSLAPMPIPQHCNKQKQQNPINLNFSCAAFAVCVVLLVLLLLFLFLCFVWSCCCIQLVAFIICDSLVLVSVLVCRCRRRRRFCTWSQCAITFCVK